MKEIRSQPGRQRICRGSRTAPVSDTVAADTVRVPCAGPGRRVFFLAPPTPREPSWASVVSGACALPEISIAFPFIGGLAPQPAANGYGRRPTFSAEF